MIFFPFATVPPMSFPKAYPAYAPVTIVTGHFCHSRSQSSGMGIAPNHAPTTVPIIAPLISSTGLNSAIISFHVEPSTPCTYTSGSVARNEMCAPASRVCVWCVVKGAPKRTRVAVRRGAATTSATVRERNAGCSSYQQMVIVGMSRCQLMACDVGDVR